MHSGTAPYTSYYIEKLGFGPGYRWTWLEIDGIPWVLLDVLLGTDGMRFNKKTVLPHPTY